MYSTTAIGSILSSARVHGNTLYSITQLLTDSRKAVPSEDVLFVAITGPRHNGHHYIGHLYQLGIRAFLVSEWNDAQFAKFPDAVFIVVPDTTIALHELATHHRKQLHFPVIGVTGSNGKTVVKEWLYQLLHHQYQIVRSPKSYNSQIGVPLSVWQMNASFNLGIFEAGISLPGEMERLEKIIAPDITIITNIRSAHDENFENRETKVTEKLKLAAHCEKLLYCKDDDLLRTLIEAYIPSERVLCWSRKSKAQLQIAKVSKSTQNTFIQGVWNSRFVEITIPFIDDASIENAIHCWLLLLHLGIDESAIQSGMLTLSPVAMRLELKEGSNQCSIINDSYNSDSASLTVALDFLNQQQQYEKKTVILSDLLQTGVAEHELYSTIAKLLRDKNVTRFIGIGPALLSNRELFTDTDSTFFNDTESFLREVDVLQFYREVILIKGARSFGFERISKMLQQKAHETILEIDLSALVDNFNYLRSKLQPATKTMAMVKAFSYGSGSFEIASVLQFHRVDYLAVAYADEGVELRKAGITLPIMVMNPEVQSYDTMIRYRLEPEIFSFRILKQFEEAAQRYRTLYPGGERIPVHIKLDTGMKRLGFEEREISELVVRLGNSKNLQPVSVFSHLVASEENALDDFTRKQIDLFKSMSGVIRKHFGEGVMRHILNSAGIQRFPDAQFEMVRMGVALYGIGANPVEQKRLQPISSLRTTISQIKNVQTGESVGYNRKFVATTPIKIATVPIGYADGLSRKLSNGNGKMYINGQAAPIVGNVCMDMCMIDITNIPCEEGDDVVVFDREHPITEVAEASGTIPYEVLTNVSRRVKRVYYQE
jgi:alanine racemase